MPSAQLKGAKVREMLALAEGYGKILADTAYGPEGPGLDADFRTMETLGVAMHQALFKGMCERLTKGQADRLPASPAAPVHPLCSPSMRYAEHGAVRQLQLAAHRWRQR
jgi:hypothetical protein